MDAVLGAGGDASGGDGEGVGDGETACGISCGRRGWTGGEGGGMGMDMAVGGSLWNEVVGGKTPLEVEGVVGLGVEGEKGDVVCARFPLEGTISGADAELELEAGGGMEGGYGNGDGPEVVTCPFADRCCIWVPLSERLGAANEKEAITVGETSLESEMHDVWVVRIAQAQRVKFRKGVGSR